MTQERKRKNYESFSQRVSQNRNYNIYPNNSYGQGYIQNNRHFYKSRTCNNGNNMYENNRQARNSDGTNYYNTYQQNSDNNNGNYLRSNKNYDRIDQNTKYQNRNFQNNNMSHRQRRRSTDGEQRREINRHDYYEIPRSRNVENAHSNRTQVN